MNEDLDKLESLVEEVRALRAVRDAAFDVVCDVKSSEGSRVKECFTLKLRESFSALDVSLYEVERAFPDGRPDIGCTAEPPLFRRCAAHNMLPLYPDGQCSEGRTREL